MMMASKSYKKHLAHKELYDALIQSLFVDEDDMDKAAADADLSNQVKKRPRKDTQPSKKSSASKESSKGKTPPKTSKFGKSLIAEELDVEHVHDMSMNVEENNVDEMCNANEQPDGEVAPNTDDALKTNWFKQPPRPPTLDPKWNKCQVTNHEGNRCPFDLKKPLPLKGCPCHLTVPVEYFFNKDLEYLKSENMERNYTMSIMKTKATRYELVRIEDMVPKQWSTIKILSEVSVKVDKQFGYGYLEEIMVRRADRQLYTFKEGDFINLHLNDIEHMLLLKRVEYVQLSAKSYQKKLSITKPQKDFPSISAKEPYTPSFDLSGVVFEDSSNQKRLMRADELYKFSDGTLKLVRDSLHHRLWKFILGYNKGMPNRKWSAKDQRWSGIMVKLIEEQLLERQIMRNLERLVGARELEMDYRLM
ncbi:hypothetical protein Tco_0237988 [Tanacetum coccineum]